MKIPKFKREQVDLSTLNYKELMNYRLNVIIKMITSAFYTLLFNSIVGLSFASLIKQHIDGNILGDVGTYSSYAMCGLGALLTNGGVLAFHIMSSKPKVNKSVTNNNMPVFRLNKLGLVFLLISVVPLLMYFVGKTIVIIKCKKYKKLHTNYTRPENERFNNDKLNGIVQDKATNMVGEVLKKVLDKK